MSLYSSSALPEHSLQQPQSAHPCFILMGNHSVWSNAKAKYYVQIILKLNVSLWKEDVSSPSKWQIEKNCFWMENEKKPVYPNHYWVAILICGAVSNSSYPPLVLHWLSRAGNSTPDTILRSTDASLPVQNGGWSVRGQRFPLSMKSRTRAVLKCRTWSASSCPCRPLIMVVTRPLHFPLWKGISQVCNWIFSSMSGAMARDRQ